MYILCTDIKGVLQISKHCTKERALQHVRSLRKLTRKVKYTLVEDIQLTLPHHTSVMLKPID